MYNHNKRSGPGRGGGRGFGRDRNSRPAMHGAVCAECGNDCEVPFRPSGGRPIYCSKCFGSKRDDKNYDRVRFDERRAPITDHRQDNIRPSGPNNSQIMEQIHGLHAKLEKVISILQPKTITVTTEAPLVLIPNAEKPKAVKSKGSKKEVKKVDIKPEDILG